MFKMDLNRTVYRYSIVFIHFIQLLINMLYDRLKYLVYGDRNNRVHVLHQSANFLVVHKPYDMFINSDNPDRKV